MIAPPVAERDVHAPFYPAAKPLQTLKSAADSSSNLCDYCRNPSFTLRYALKQPAPILISDLSGTYTPISGRFRLFPHPQTSRGDSKKPSIKTNGAEGIRTPDPRIANAVLYQLSYNPGNLSLQAPGHVWCQGPASLSHGTAFEARRFHEHKNGNLCADLVFDRCA